MPPPAPPGVAAVIFDVYGTLLRTGDDDPAPSSREDILRAILHDLAPSHPLPPASLTELLLERIGVEHARLRAAGIDYPEVEIRDLWSEVLALPRGVLVEEIALAFERAIHPTSPMPGAKELLAALRGRGLPCGLVSNAQFYTPLLLESHFGLPLQQLGFAPDLTFFSYQHRQAKPGLRLYELLRDALAARGIDPAATLYLGNDALKDIHPAASLGFRTALFAGHPPSLRLRPEHPALLPPDSTLHHLSEVLHQVP